MGTTGRLRGDPEKAPCDMGPVPIVENSSPGERASQSLTNKGFAREGHF